MPDKYNVLKALMFKDHELTPVIHNQTGEPWFYADQVCSILDIKNARDAVSRIKDEWKAKIGRYDGSQNRQVNIISEAGLNKIIFKSNKPEAETFQDWVFEEVLPSVRKTGNFRVLDSRKQALFLAQNLIDMQKQLEAQQPSVDFARQIASSKGSVKVGEFAKMLYGRNLVIGRDRLFAWLYAKKFLMNSSTPYQKYMNKGIFEVVSGSVKGSTTGRIWKMVKITAKGVVFLTEKIIESGDFELDGAHKCPS